MNDTDSGPMSVADLCERGGYAIQKKGAYYFDQELYRNLFCVMCNGIDIKEAQCYTWRPTWYPMALGLRVLMDTSFQSLQVKFSLFVLITVIIVT